ncbi:hypothetical protein EXU30_03465 [Shewanella maritima]|uniref:Uncharacterized protein n=1 Tax=Shewanella maritima TaxID=2520507 RepID=A0A411PEM6_9GAMM|nr:hypothetical protein [Shewanella maritima]QBF81860.1 hypothetical protein EXU30_03465 [Shewanella maritima]
MRNKTTLRVVAFALALSSFAANSNGVVASKTVLDFAVESPFNQVSISITGPDGFSTQIDLYDDNLQLDIDALGTLASGNYSYKAQYISNGKIEIISDASTGRDGATRNKGLVQTKTGFFNVVDSEFVTVDEQNSVIEPKFQEQ